MKVPFVLTPHAEQDIDDIWDYIAADKIDAADRVLAALEKAMSRLTKALHSREDLAISDTVKRRADLRHGYHDYYAKRRTVPPLV